MKNYLFYDEETGEHFFVQDESLWKANETAHKYFKRPSPLTKWMTQRLRCTDTIPTKIKELREGRSKAPFPKMKGVINHEYRTIAPQVSDRVHSPHWIADRYNSLSDWFIPSNYLGETGRADFLNRLFF